MRPRRREEREGDAKKISGLVIPAATSAVPIFAARHEWFQYGVAQPLSSSRLLRNLRAFAVAFLSTLEEELNIARFYSQEPHADVSLD